MYNGNAGWAKEMGNFGICHAELQSGLSSGAAKVRLIELLVPPAEEGPAKERNERFRTYVMTQSLFRGVKATTGEVVIQRCKEALRDAVAE